MKDIHTFLNNLIKLLDEKHPWEDHNVKIHTLKFGWPRKVARITLTNCYTQDELQIGFDDKGQLQFRYYEHLNNNYLTQQFESLSGYCRKQTIKLHLYSILGI